MTTRPHTLYVITCSVNGKMYIGVTCRSLSQRWTEHVLASEFRRPAYVIHRAMRKHGLGAFRIDVLHVYASEVEAYHAEEACVALLNLTHTGYNASQGGRAPALGIPHTASTKRKISQALIGRVCTEHARHKISAALCGRTHDDRRRANISRSHYARWMRAQGTDTALPTVACGVTPDSACRIDNIYGDLSW